MPYILVTTIQPVPKQVSTIDPPLVSTERETLGFFNRCIICKKNLVGYIFKIVPICKECGSKKPDKDEDEEKPKNKKRGRKDYKPVRFISKK